MPAFSEETFGPLAAMIRAKDEEEAFALSEQSKYGLGVTVCTTNIEKAMSMAGRVSDGAYFINELRQIGSSTAFWWDKIFGVWT